jgi:hypothetical protein
MKMGYAKGKVLGRKKRGKSILINIPGSSQV